MTKILKTGVLEWDLPTLAQALRLTEADTVNYFTDGRRVSFIIERRLSNEVMPGKLAGTEGADFDLVDEVGGKWEVRSVTAQGIYFCPSYMVGSGRTFDELGFLRKLANIQGYIVCDVTLFPKVPYWIFGKELVEQWYVKKSLGAGTKISRARALQLLKDAATAG